MSVRDRRVAVMVYWVWHQVVVGDAPILPQSACSDLTDELQTWRIAGEGG